MNENLIIRIKDWLADLKDKEDITLLYRASELFREILENEKISEEDEKELLKEFEVTSTVLIMAKDKKEADRLLKKEREDEGNQSELAYDLLGSAEIEEK